MYFKIWCYVLSTFSFRLQQLGFMATCVICLETITNKTVCIPCYHEFCSSCILEWNLQNNTCPLCRKNVVNVQIVPSLLSESYQYLNIILRRLRNFSKYILLLWKRLFGSLSRRTNNIFVIVFWLKGHIKIANIWAS